MDITKPNNKLTLQGDLVLIVVDKQESLFTIVRFQDGKVDKLQLVNRIEKSSEHIDLTQAVFDSMTTIKHEKAKWKLVL